MYIIFKKVYLSISFALLGLGERIRGKEIGIKEISSRKYVLFEWIYGKNSRKR